MERKLWKSKPVAKSALTGLLVLLFLVSGTLAASNALHDSLHKNGAGSHHFCLVCSFAKGQVDAAEVSVVTTRLVFWPLFNFRAVSASPLPAFDYRLSPSRAPPALASLLSVVA